MKSGKTIKTAVGVILAVGFVFAGCETGMGPTANTDSKTILITGFPVSSYSGKSAVLTLHHSVTDDKAIAVGVVPQINNAKLTLPLYINEYFEARWKGSGEYYVVLTILTGQTIEKMLVYSPGVEPNDFGTNIPRYSITERESTISFSGFKDITRWLGENGADPTTDTDSKTILITGFPVSSYSGKSAVLTLHHSVTSDEAIAVGVVPQINGARLTFPLYTNEHLEARWKGSGEYYVVLTILTGQTIEKMLVYSPGVEPNNFGTNIPRYSITERESTISFSGFKDITDLVGGTGTGPTTDTDSKTITITGFPGGSYSGKVAGITLYASMDTEEVTAIGGVLINGNTLSIPLYTDADFETRWKGKGDYYILLGILKNNEQIEKMFIYSKEVPNYYGTNVPKYSITESESIIPYGDFYDITDQVGL
jgi:hypothetical protein